MKTVRFRDQLIRFQIPDSWAEEHDPKGASCYDPNDLSVVLRLNVSTILWPHDLSIEQDAQFFATSGPNADGACEPLACGQALTTLAVKVSEDRTVEDHHWTLARVVPPRTVRIAIFTTSVFPEQTTRAHASEVLEMLRVQVCAAILLDTPAVPDAKPLWKRLLGF